jgi:hypothetical protein
MDKDRERFYVERFLTAINITKFDLRDGESPDFIIAIDATYICLEVTELFRKTKEGSPPRQAIEKQREYIVNLAANIWNQRNCQNIDVSIDFGFRENYPKSEAQSLAHQIVDIVSKNIPPSDSFAFVDAGTIGEEGFPIDIAYISIINLPTYKKSYWSVSDVSSIPKADQAMIQSAITKKQNANYKVGKDAETWLLIVADSSRLSSNFEFSQQVLDETYTSSFDKVYLFDTVLNAARLLVTKK